jgi:hypothetical protein
MSRQLSHSATPQPQPHPAQLLQQQQQQQQAALKRKAEAAGGPSAGDPFKSSKSALTSSHLRQPAGAGRRWETIES